MVGAPTSGGLFPGWAVFGRDVQHPIATAATPGSTIVDNGFVPRLLATRNGVPSA